MADMEPKKIHILETAAGLFSSHGYDRTSIRLLADKARVSTSTIYAYFEDKSDILFHTLDYSIQSMAEDLADVIDGKADALTTFAASIRKLHTAVAADPLIRKVLTRDGDIVDRELVEEAARTEKRIADLAVKALRHAVKTGEIDCPDVAALEAVCRLSMRGWLLGAEKGLDEVSEPRLTNMLVVLIEGLAPRKS